MNTSQLLASTMLSASNTLYANGTLVIYSGTQPASPETALSGNTALVTFTFSSSPFGTPSFSSPYEQMTASFVSTTGTFNAAGTAVWARAYESNGTTALADYTVGTSGTDIILGNTSIQSGVPVVMGTFLQRLPAV